MPTADHPRGPGPGTAGDRKSTRLNSSHSQISYAVFCLKKKTSKTGREPLRYSMMIGCAVGRDRAELERRLERHPNPPPISGTVDEVVFFFLMIRQPRRSTLFPYTTLFR